MDPTTARRLSCAQRRRVSADASVGSVSRSLASGQSLSIDSVLQLRAEVNTQFAARQLGAEPTGELTLSQSLTGDQTLVEWSQTEEQPAAIP